MSPWPPPLCGLPGSSTGGSVGNDNSNNRVVIGCMGEGCGTGKPLLCIYCIMRQIMSRWIQLGGSPGWSTSGSGGNDNSYKGPVIGCMGKGCGTGKPLLVNSAPNTYSLNSTIRWITRMEFWLKCDSGIIWQREEGDWDHFQVYKQWATKHINFIRMKFRAVSHQIIIVKTQK